MKKIIICLSFVLLLSGCGSNLPNNQPEVITNTNNNEQSVQQVPALTTEQLQQKLTEFYLIYNDKKFSDLPKYLAPQLEQYISLKNTTAGAIIADAEKFFANKTYVHYRPFLNALKIDDHNVKLGLQMSWSYSTPPNEAIGFETIYAKDVYAVVSLDFDQNWKIKKYLEEYIVRPEFKLLKDQTAIEDNDAKESKDLERVSLKAGEVVTSDLLKRQYETVSWWKSSEERIIYQDKKYWLTMHTYHAASYNETFEQLLEPVAINVAEPYYQYFSGFYTIDTLEGGYLLMTMNPKTLIGETVYKFSVADGDRFAVGKVFGNRLVEIVATWVPSGPIEHKYYDLKNKKFLPLKFVEAVTLADDKLYFLQENATPFNIYYYYGDEVDRGGYPNQLRVIDLNDYKISDLYTADFGYLRVKELKPRQIILQENMFDKNVELNYQSTKAEISKVFLGQKDVLIDY